MGLLGRFRTNASQPLGEEHVRTHLETDRDRQERLGHSLHGGPVLQTPEEQQATRDRMVAELGAQRETGRLPTKD